MEIIYSDVSVGIDLFYVSKKSAPAERRFLAAATPLPSSGGAGDGVCISDREAVAFRWT
jgi:hypothetical protein